MTFVCGCETIWIICTNKTKNFINLKKNLRTSCLSSNPRGLIFTEKKQTKLIRTKKFKFCSHVQNAEGISFKIKNDFLPKNQTDTYESKTIDIIKFNSIIIFYVLLLKRQNNSFLIYFWACIESRAYDMLVLSFC